MQFDIYNPYKNKAVTNDYVCWIEEGLKKIGHSTNQIIKLKKNTSNREKGLVVIVAGDVIKGKKMGYKKVVCWVQGVSEAESFMRHHSWLRFFVLSVLNKLAFKKTDFFLFCSEGMKHYYEKRFRRTYNNSYIMPCFNDEIKENSFQTDNKYNNNIFIYAGSLAVWQCYEDTVKLYREVEKRVDNCSLRLLVKDREEALKILNKYGVERYSIEFVPKERVADEMAKAKFGFCIREDNIVNRVSTPTKLSSYVANGVIPIYTQYIESFYKIAENCKYCVCLKDYHQTINHLVSLCNEQIFSKEIYKDYSESFGEYYSSNFHIEKLAEALKKQGL